VGWVVVKEPVQQVDWGPHGLSKDDLGRGADYDAYEAHDGECEWDSKKLRNARRKRTPRARCEIRGVAAAPGTELADHPRKGGGVLKMQRT
jgi:hypothetical protein